MSRSCNSIANLCAQVARLTKSQQPKDSASPTA